MTAMALPIVQVVVAAALFFILVLVDALTDSNFVCVLCEYCPVVSWDLTGRRAALASALLWSLPPGT